MSDEKRKVVPRSEQETIVSYDVERKQWHIYTDYPKHVRKYAILLGKIDKNDELPLVLDEYVDSDEFTASFSIRKKRELSAEERQAMSDRMHKQHGGN